MEHTEIERSRRILSEFGWNTTCYQIVNPGMTRWFSQAGDAVIGYVRKSKVRVVAGAPVCAVDRLESVVQEFESESALWGDRVCYFGAEDRMRSYTSVKSGYSAVVLGAQPVWSPRNWLSRFNSDKSLRAQRARARNKGVRIKEWESSRATDDPELRRVLLEWLKTRGLPPMHFLVEPETLGMLEGRRVFVAEQEGRPLGFTVLSPVPERAGWLTEQFVRGRDAPNGTVELLIEYAVEAVASTQAKFITMGIVPLARCQEAMEVGNPWWLRLLTHWARAHGRRFYNFEGLEWFKEKFHPDEWEPIYVISNEERFTVRTLYAVAGAFTGGPPIFALAGGLFGAARQELNRAGPGANLRAQTS